VTSTPWEHQHEVRDALRTIVTDPQLGIPALSNAPTMSNLLKDLLPDAPKETSVLVAAAEAGLPQVLKDHVDQGMDLATASSLTASAFAARTPFTPDACGWVVGELAVALGLAPDTPAGQPQGAGPLPSFTPSPGVGIGAGTGPAAETIGPGGFGGEQGGFPHGGAAQPQPGVFGQQGGYGQQQGGFGGQPQAGFGQQGGFGRPAAGRGGSAQTPFGAPAQGGFGGDQTMPPTMGPATMGPGPAMGGAQTQMPGGGGGAPTWSGGPPPGGQRQRVPKFWGYLVAALVAVAVIAGIFAVVHGHSGGTTAEPLSKVIKPDVGRCKAASTLEMRGVTSSLSCTTSAHNIGLSAFQYDNTADFQAGLARLNKLTGWNPSAAGKSCPPPAGSSTGQEGWHTLHNPKYKTLRSDQILECYPETGGDGRFLYLWTLPTQRVILVAGNPGSGASYTNLQKWWQNLTYG
jgi:hypothetical protein